MYPTPPAGKPPSAQTADTLILIGFILQLVLALIWIAEAALSLVALAVFGLYAAGFAGAYHLLLLIDLFGVWYVYTHFYERSKAGNYLGAQDAGILSIIFGLIGGGVIAGVLYIVAYLKLGDAIHEQRAMAGGAGMVGPYPAAPPYSAPPPGAAPSAPPIAATSPPLPTAPGAAPIPPPAPICPRCGKPGTWIEQYHRYYCYTDQQYL